MLRKEKYSKITKNHLDKRGLKWYTKVDKFLQKSTKY